MKNLKNSHLSLFESAQSERSPAAVGGGRQRSFQNVALLPEAGERVADEALADRVDVGDRLGGKGHDADARVVRRHLQPGQHFAHKAQLAAEVVRSDAGRGVDQENQVHAGVGAPQQRVQAAAKDFAQHLHPRRFQHVVVPRTVHFAVWKITEI